MIFWNNKRATGFFVSWYDKMILRCIWHSLKWNCRYFGKIIITGFTRSCQLPVKKISSISLWHHQLETFPRYWPFVRAIHRSPMDSPHKGQWRGALVFFFICAWTNGWANNRDVETPWRSLWRHYNVEFHFRFSAWGVSGCQSPWIIGYWWLHLP